MSEMSNEELATRLICVLSQEMIEEAKLFRYVCWLEESGQKERVHGAPCLVMASDGETFWAEFYEDAVRQAFAHDKELFEASEKYTPTSDEIEE